MKKTLSLLAILAVGAAAPASAQTIVNQWLFNDVSGTDLGAAVASVGSATFSSNLGGGGTWQTNGSGLLSGQGRIGNADVADFSTGIYQYDLVGVTMTTMSGATDDSVFFGLRSFSAATNTSFTSSSGSDQATIVFGNENNTGGLDFRIYNATVGSAIINTSLSFSDTYDFRIILDLDNNTADYLYQANGGGYTSIIAQQVNAVATITFLGLGSNALNETVNINQAQLSAIPEPSTALMLLSGLGVLALRRRR